MAIEGLVDNTTGLAIADADARYSPSSTSSSFEVDLTSSVSSVTGSGTSYTVALDNEVSDPDNVWNNTTYIGTIPSGKSGLWLFSYAQELNTFSGNNTDCTVSIVTTGTYAGTYILKQVGDIAAEAGLPGPGTNVVHSLSKIIRLDVNDTFKVVVTISGGASDTIGITSNATTRLIGKLL